MSNKITGKGNWGVFAVHASLLTVAERLTITHFHHYTFTQQPAVASHPHFRLFLNNGIKIVLKEFAGGEAAVNSDNYLKII
jgi:hypothetical protein